MTTRDELRRAGAALHARLFEAIQSQRASSQRDSGGAIPGIGDVVDELTFGACGVWQDTPAGDQPRVGSENRERGHG